MKKKTEEARRVKSNISTSVKTQVRGNIVVLGNPDGKRAMLLPHGNAYAGYSNRVVSCCAVELPMKR